MRRVGMSRKAVRCGVVWCRVVSCLLPSQPPSKPEARPQLREAEILPRRSSGHFQTGRPAWRELRYSAELNATAPVASRPHPSPTTTM